MQSVENSTDQLENLPQFFASIFVLFRLLSGLV